jgi:acyl-CoA synthetase (NDP forming)
MTGFRRRLRWVERFAERPWTKAAWRLAGRTRCYPDLQSIPCGVDGAVIITRPETTEHIVHDCSDAGVRRVWMHQSLAKGSSVSPAAVEYCRLHEISVIAGACPMM